MMDNIYKDSTENQLELSESEIKPGFIFEYVDQKGVISKISSILANNDINIANMTVTREGDVATMKCQFEGKLQENVKEQLLNSFTFIRTEFLNME
ncbi:ACT domain-containing protein [Gudongella sp. SC589]|jgi:L-serine dehydratase|uniref:ACT domain-containing protein n=1 Tax=Gudongella sp. SC589 TaxID=3385990 RepID=UPI0039046C1E